MGAVRTRVQTADKNITILFQTCSFWLHRTLTDGLEWCGLLVMFLSAVWTHFDGTHSLQRIIGEQVMQCYISPNLFQWTNKLHLGWPEGEYIFSTFFFYFWVSYSFSMTTVAPSRVFSNKIVSPAVHQPWNTPPLLDTALCFLWFSPGRTSWCGFHTGMTALSPASPTP